MTFLWMPGKHLQGALLNSAAFSPAAVSAVSAWLRLAGGTITGSGYSSVPDVLAINPATQGTDADRPPNSNSANGLPRLDFTPTQLLSWPAASNNNQTVTSGFVAWIEPDIVTAGVRAAFSAIPGATNRVEIIQSAADLFVDVYISQFSTRRGTASGVLSASTKAFLTWEYDGGGATDAAKCVITIDGTPIALTFSDSSGAPGAMPATLVSTAGPFGIGGRLADAQGFDGKIGPNIYILGSKMTGATEGLLTAAARTALMNFERPT